MMKTVSVGIQNLCAPCGCACRYCLLHSHKESGGIDYYRGRRIAERFLEWTKRKGFPNPPYYSVGYCAEYPELFDNIAFNKQAGAPGADCLQCNGLKIREKEETDAFILQLKAAGITAIDTTFFGDENCHDTFAAREGDYRFMLRLARSAVENGVFCAPSVVITEENLPYLPELFHVLSGLAGHERIHSFLQDYRGRGYLLENVRLSEESCGKLPDAIKSTLNLARYKTEKAWLTAGALPEYTKRALIVTLRTDNIDMFEKMSCDEIVAYVEKLDDEYYSAIPQINELAEIYGDRTNTKLYRLRDLMWKWQKQYIADHGIDIYNVTDERFCSTIRS